MPAPVFRWMGGTELGADVIGAPKCDHGRDTVFEKEARFAACHLDVRGVGNLQGPDHSGKAKGQQRHSAHRGDWSNSEARGGSVGGATVARGALVRSGIPPAASPAAAGTTGGGWAEVWALLV
ncbi:hypothetical protein AAFF_G00101860 [Aldrovandia affinis]|uniref:Uncharacterized protein n=1 Tax=Aldrovandia affinis TaxID=143900 RepID=A0AAD7RUP9_9TELE|nr:hypothetical protein AAFF_G00101860 [Aldrovandia affinis]